MKRQLPKLAKNTTDYEELLKNIGEEMDIDLFKDISTQTNLISDILAIFNRIIYIPFLYFKLKPDDFEIEKNCIEILMKGEKNLQTYLTKSLDFDTNFYCIDIEFWNYLSKLNNNQIDKDVRRPTISFTAITGEYEGQLKQNLQLFKDFIIIPEKLYDLLVRWYLSIGNEIKLNRITYKNNGDTEYLGATIYKKNQDSITEIEIYPVTAKHFQFEELTKNVAENGSERITDYLKLVSEVKMKNINRLTNFSRKCQFFSIKEQLEKYYMVANIKSRLWVYYKTKFYVPRSMEKTLEDEGIKDFCIFVLEIMNNNSWISETFQNDKTSNEKMNKSLSENISRNFIGIKNIGNTCYMNAVLQILLNLKEIYQVFLSQKFKQALLNFEKRNNKDNNKAIFELIKLLFEKWEGKVTTLIPIKFKELIGEINNQFKFNDQQDAQEFFNFLLDTLHEEINLKKHKEYISNPDNYDGNDQQLANEYWANNLRRNVSFIQSLFLGQLKSNLACSKCNTNKITFETFTNLIMPIPQKKTIVLDIILHRIPFVFKMYYLDICNNKELQSESDVRDSMTRLRKESIDKHAEYSNGESCELYAKQSGDKFYAFRSSTSIPIKVVIEIDRKNKVSKIIECLKDIKELELEKDSKLTEFVIMTSESVFIDKELTIDESFQPYQTITVYELLNSNGIYKYLFNEDASILIPAPMENLYNLTGSSKGVYSLSNDICCNFNRPAYLDRIFTNKIQTEYLIEITHRYTNEAREYLFRRQTLAKTEHLYSIILVNNKVTVILI
jgi:hypothetical protein